jgi:hypothetical protein
MVNKTLSAECTSCVMNIYPQGMPPSPLEADYLFLLGLVHNLNDLVHYRGIRKLRDALARFSTHPERVTIIHARQPQGWKTLTVDVSPNWSSSPAKIFRMMRRIILPDRVLGRSGTMKIAFGAANGPIDLRTCSMRSFFTWSLDSVPSLSATKAFTAWPVSSSLIPTTAASATESALILVAVVSKKRHQVTHDAQ